VATLNVAWDLRQAIKPQWIPAKPPSIPIKTSINKTFLPSIHPHCEIFYVHGQNIGVVCGNWTQDQIYTFMAQGPDHRLTALSAQIGFERLVQCFCGSSSIFICYCIWTSYWVLSLWIDLRYEDRTLTIFKGSTSYNRIIQRNQHDFSQNLPLSSTK